MGKQRPAIKPSEKLKVWVRAGGRCAICTRYLLEDGLVGVEVTSGEMAHIIGQAANEDSPRGVYNRPKDERNDADNLVLMCPNDHTAIDLRQLADLMTVDRVLEMKHRHEDRILHATELVAEADTVVLRLIGDVPGATVELTRQTTAAAVLAAGSRFPNFDLAFDRHSIEIDLQHIPGNGNKAYFRNAAKAIDAVCDHRLHDGIVTRQIQHLSVFAFARLPLLVYLGSKLDDTIGVDLFQRQRTTDSWTWQPGKGARYQTICHRQGTPDGSISLMVNISGNINDHELPAALNETALYEIRPTMAPCDTTRFRTSAEFANFSDEYRRFLGRLELDHKRARKLHLFAAAPVAAAVELGRARDPNVHPTFVVYQRTVTAGQPTYEMGLVIK